MWKPLIRCWKIIKQYLCNCTIHGVRYLADDQFSYFERLFWLVACALCWWGCTNMVIAVIDDYLEKPISIAIETTHLHWETPFPAVAFCMTTNAVIKKKYFKMKPGTFPNYTSAAAAKATAEELLGAFEELQVPFSNFFQNCKWNERNFNCSEEFQPMYKSGLGYCIAFNSIHTPIGKKYGIRYMINETVRLGDLVIDIVDGKQMKNIVPYLEMYLLGNAQLPLVSTDEDKKFRPKMDSTTYVPFVLMNTANQKAVKDVDIKRRNCRYTDELISGSFFDTYSQDTCILQVAVEQMIRFCGCVHFYYHAPPGTTTCSMKEQQCILEHKSEITSNEAIHKRCDVDCEETRITLNHLDPLANEATNTINYHFSLLAHPTTRIRRYVVHDILEIVVSVGGALGLFMGASILSIFEIPYWLFIRRDKIQ